MVVEVASTGEPPEVMVMVTLEAAIHLRTTMVDRVVLREVSQTPVRVASLVPVPVQLVEGVTLGDLHRREDRLDLDREPVDMVVSVEVTPKK